MASIRDVAKKAGVAACTVSRVLNGTAAVSQETRIKIEKAMKELDYIPNELARGMFRQKSGIFIKCTVLRRWEGHTAWKKSWGRLHIFTTNLKETIHLEATN